METTKEQQELYDSDLKAKSAYHGGIQFAADKAAKDNSKLIAGKLKKEGLPLEEIMKYTGLSEEEVKQLK